MVGASEQIEEEEEDNLIDLPEFEAEEEPEEFFKRSVDKAASGKFIALVKPSPKFSIDKDADWKIDPSPAWITGDGINSEMVTPSDQGNEYDFLKVSRRGPKSRKRAVMRSGTKLSIDSKICKIWATHFLEKGWFNQSEIETLINLCEGNGDMEELRMNLQRTLEAAGLELVDEVIEENFPLWDARTDVLLDDLVEAIEATFTRAIQLPGTQSFNMSKSNEVRLFEPMVQAKQELQLSILTCKPAVEIVLGVIELIRRNHVASKSNETTSYCRANNEETANFFKAADTLKFWQINGRIMDGKRRRKAFKALETLDLSIAFFREVAKTLRENEINREDAGRLDEMISLLEVATERIILEHLPYVRRFASRNVEPGEDPEDVFQVAFMGLQRSIRLFNPDFGNRFVVYCAQWMNASLMQWRASEGEIIHIPAYLHKTLDKLDRAMEGLEPGFDRIVSNDELADELEWKSEDVKWLRRIPRQSEHPGSIEEWEKVFLEPEFVDTFDQAEKKRVIDNILGELPKRQADVIRMRFGIGYDNEMTLQEIGEIYEVTRERIRQIEARGLAQLLRHPRRKRHLQTLLGI